MSIHDEIGSMSGSQFHLWRSERASEIVAANQISPERSKLKVDLDLGELYPETGAAEIARIIYEGSAIEFGTESFRIARILANQTAFAASQPDRVEAFGFRKSDGEFKDLVGIVSQNDERVANGLTLGWLYYAFEVGATPGDLLNWGVNEFLVIQLQWWQRREGETLLNQHIRALRNGWGLPWLSKATRDNYGNLIREINRGNVPDQIQEHFKNEIAEVRELLTFFGELDLPNETKNEPSRLSANRATEWANAFAKSVHFIAPDAKGRWGSLPEVSLKAGELRGCAAPVARYLDELGYQPSDIGGKLTQAFFGRVGDVVGK